VLVEDDPVLHPAVGDAGQRTWGRSPADVDDAVAELVHEADRLADRAERVTAPEWARTARVAGHDADVSAQSVLWDAVDTAIADLRAAESALQEVRGRA
jgi:hypothetical protein